MDHTVFEAGLFPLKLLMYIFLTPLKTTQNVGFGIVIALGLTAALGFWYTTIHGVLPFLALGIGIDNMFVILRCLENIPEEERYLILSF